MSNKPITTGILSYFKDKLTSDIREDMSYKLDAPLNNGEVTNGTAGYVLETNGDGTTSWVYRPRIYIGSDEMPEGYDIKFDPNAEPIEFDDTLTTEGAIADAKAVGDALNAKLNKPTSSAGTAGQVLVSNGDGTTSWESQPKIYIGSGELPDGYDIGFDPNAEPIEIDHTLSVEGAVAEAKAVGDSIRLHNTSSTAHEDIRNLITGLNTRLNALADSDDTTLDQLSEIVAYIKSNKSLIESITTNKVSTSDIVDNLTTSNASKVLSAKQGVALKGLIDDLQTAIENVDVSADIEAHNTNTSAHNDIRTSISDLESVVNSYDKPINNMQLDIESIYGSLSSKQNNIIGGASTITSDNLIANRALISDGNGKVAASSITSAELEYLDGVTSNIQSQLNNIHFYYLTEVQPGVVSLETYLDNEPSDGDDSNIITSIHLTNGGNKYFSVLWENILNPQTGDNNTLGLTKLYSASGSASDGTMTQDAITKYVSSAIETAITGAIAASY